MPNKSLLFLSGLLLSACAQIYPPSGGEKDTTSPGVSKSEPLNYSTNFKGKRISMSFDEFVTINSLGQEIIVSPPLEEPPEFRIKGKTLIIDFDEELRENTTYTFNLGAGVVDYHEGNPLDSSVFVFSTGPDLDSLQIRGQVKDAFDLKPQEKVLVMLYLNPGDSVPAKERPYYFTKTNKNGTFHLQHLKEGEYVLFALEDKNNNYLYDLPNERISFLNELVDVSAPDSTYEMSMFREDNEKQFIKSSKEVRYGVNLLVFNKPFDKVAMQPTGDMNLTELFAIDTAQTKDSIWLFTKRPLEEDLQVELIVRVDEKKDTLSLKWGKAPKKKEDLDKLVPKPKLSTNRGIARYFEPLSINFELPMRMRSGATATFVMNGDTGRVDILQLDKKRFRIDTPLVEDGKYQLMIRDSVFFDLLGIANDSFKESFRTKSAAEYANLKVTIEAQEGSKVLQLMNSEEKILREDLFTSGSIEYPNLEPGKYLLKMIFDENGDGKWTTGTFGGRTQPERVIYYSGELEMKEGWDSDITWIIP